MLFRENKKTKLSSEKEVNKSLSLCGEKPTVLNEFQCKRENKILMKTDLYSLWSLNVSAKYIVS